jgi:hypothetical protein
VKTRAADDEFVWQNKQTIHCLAMNAADVLFSAAAMARTFGEPGPGWWIVAENAVNATAQLYACVGPPHEVYEEAFEGQNKRCQCAEVGGQLFLEWLDATGNRTTLSQSELVEAKEIKDAQIADGIASCNWVTVDGENKIATYDIETGSTPIWYIVPTLNTDCCSGTISPPPVQPLPEPYPFPTELDGCQTEVQLISSCIDKYGLHQNFYRVVYSEVLLNSVGNPYCNTQTPKYYWETIRGPYIYPRSADFEGFDCEPPYAPPHPDAADPILNVGNCNPGLSPVQYHLDVGCTYNPDTDDFDTKYFYDVEATNDGIFGLSRRIDALAWMINNAQLIPYTSCATKKPVLEGDWVTLRFESEEPSPNGHSPIRKLLRYRSKSNASLGSITDYWRGFTWTTGPVIVTHKDAWWGTPQVWAVSADEGKRVLRHAAGEAGIDPDQVGRWEISGSRNARYGVSLPVRFADLDGGPWVTQRDGPSGPALINR